MGVAELWATLEHAIRTYTGLSPATFFTSVAIAFAFYYAVSSFFEPAPVPRKREVEVEPVEPLPPPVQLGEIDAEELLAFDGSDPKKPLLMAIKGQIYDVTQSRMFYGPGGPYALFAGKDASRALAKMSFEQKDLTGDISGLGPFELEALQDWEYKFMSKYVKVGTIKKTILVTDDPSDSANSSGITTDAGNQTTEVTSRTVDSSETSHTPELPTADDDAKVIDHKTEAEAVAALKHDEAKEVDQTAEEVQKVPKHDEAKEVDQTAEEVHKD